MRIAIGIVMYLICLPLSAQWLNYPTPGIPRLADGKPNLTAAAPRGADGKPDLSGIWGLSCPVANGVNGTIRGANVYCATEVSVPAEFFDFGQSIIGDNHNSVPNSTIGPLILNNLKSITLGHT
jgi:hypothetical protein